MLSIIVVLNERNGLIGDITVVKYSISIHTIIMKTMKNIGKCLIELKTARYRAEVYIVTATAWVLEGKTEIYKKEK